MEVQISQQHYAILNKTMFKNWLEEAMITLLKVDLPFFITFKGC